MDRRDRFAANGPRFGKADDREMTVTITVMDEEGDESEFVLPARFEVCGTCEGRGKHVNPSVDAHGIGAEEWENEWAPEEREAYLNGGYDITCSECGGKRVVPAIDEGRLDDEQKTAWDAFQEQEEQRAAWDREQESERRMGA